MFLALSSCRYAGWGSSRDQLPPEDPGCLAGPALEGAVEDGGLRIAEDLGDQRQRHLSVAEQKMVEILKAMVHNASFIIMDEPTASLTRQEVEALMAVVRDLQQKNIRR